MKISVLGCGWLGFPLAQYLLREGYEVKGSTTTKDKVVLLKQAGIEAHKIQIPSTLDDSDSKAFWDTDILILNIPPERGSENIDKDYPALINQIVDKAVRSGISWIIFASSTSVYSETGGLTSENQTEKGKASRPSGEAVLEAENVIKNSGMDFTILRFGGLYGYDRHPVKYLSGKKNLGDPEKTVNLVHQVDCIKAVHEVVRQNSRNEIFNVVSDGHPPRKEFYQSAASHFNMPLPEFKKETSNKNYRIVSNRKLKETLDFSFTYPNPMDHTP
jgi:nucleoside-diphosphate-sugar epimerase